MSTVRTLGGSVRETVVPPPGFWQRDTAHYLTPLTPATAATAEEFAEGMPESCREMGFLIDGLQTVDIGGWSYTRVVPVGDRTGPPPPAWLFAVLVRVVPSLRRRCRAARRALAEDLPGTLVERWWTVWRAQFDTRAAALRDVDLAELDDPALRRHLGTALRLHADGGRVHFRLHGAACVILAEFVTASRDLLGWDDTQAITLLAGASTTSTAPVMALDDLAVAAGQHTAVRAALAGDADLATVLGADLDFTEAFEAYLRDFGGRIPHLELAEPSLAENPELLLGLLRDRLDDPPPDGADQARDAAVAPSLAGAERARFDRLYARALRAYGVREDDHFRTASVPSGLIRAALLEVGRRLERRGLIDGRDDVFNLTPVEAGSALVDGLDARVRVRTRTAERAWALAHPGPATYGDPPGPPPPLRVLPRAARQTNQASLWLIERTFAPAGPPSTAAAASATLTGHPASGGQARAIARVIRTESEFERLRPGEVLVCPITTPVWSVLFANAAALVTDSGGILSHPAIIAREFGIPAVVGTGRATTAIPDGAEVLVDGTTGTVETLP